MIEIHNTLRESFDFVIYDTPALVAVTDAWVLSGLVEGTIMVARSVTVLALTTSRRDQETRYVVGAMGSRKSWFPEPVPEAASIVTTDTA